MVNPPISDSEPLDLGDNTGQPEVTLVSRYPRLTKSYCFFFCGVAWASALTSHWSQQLELFVAFDISTFIPDGREIALKFRSLANGKDRPLAVSQGHGFIVTGIRKVSYGHVTPIIIATNKNLQGH